MDNRKAIIIDNVTKFYRTYRRDTGFIGALKNLVVRNYENVLALYEVSFDVSKGTILGLIGPNGAGKTTTIKLLTGVIRPDSGEITVNGQSPWTDRNRFSKNIGVVFGQRTQLWWDLSVYESLQLLAKIYELSDTRFKEQLDLYNRVLDLDEILYKPVRELSLGQRMKSEFAAGLIHDPAILFLDEPTIGMDITTKQKIREHIRTINTQYGKTIILTTHDVSDIENLCEDIVVIDKGVKVFDNTLNEMKRLYSSHREIILIFNRELDESMVNSVTVFGEKVQTRLNDEKNTLSLFVNREITNKEIINHLLSRFGDNLVDIRFPSLEIEKIIRNIYDGNTITQ